MCIDNHHQQHWLCLVVVIIIIFILQPGSLGITVAWIVRYALRSNSPSTSSYIYVYIKESNYYFCFITICLMLCILNGTSLLCTVFLILWDRIDCFLRSVFGSDIFLLYLHWFSFNVPLCLIFTYIYEWMQKWFNTSTGKDSIHSVILMYILNLTFKYPFQESHLTISPHYKWLCINTWKYLKGVERIVFGNQKFRYNNDKTLWKNLHPQRTQGNTEVAHTVHCY